jgi:hypothetical protein
MDRKKDLEACLVIILGLLVFFLIKGWYPLLTAALVIGLIGVFLKKPAAWISWLWYKLAELIGKVFEKVILSLLFFLFLYPISLLSRIFRKDSMNTDKRTRSSTWVNREQVFSKDDLTKPW